MYTNSQLLDIISRLLPYAESRAEDMSESLETMRLDVHGGALTDQEALVDKAWMSVVAAEAALKEA